MPTDDPKPNWHIIAVEYETGDDSVTYEYLSGKHGIPYSSLSKRGARESWKQRRARHRQELGNEIRHRIRERQAREVEQDYERLHQAAERLGDCITSGELSANSLDAACRALIEVVKAKEVLAGSVSDRTETRIDPWQWLREGMAILNASTEADD